MALITEDGTGLSTAESYCSVDEADDYFESRYGADNHPWLELDTEEKEPLLRQATDYMVEQYRGAWKGEPKNGTMALDWPRYNVVRDEALDTVISGDIVPPEVKRACAELAYRANSAALTVDVAPTDQQITSETVGPISVSYSVSGQKQTQYSKIDNMLGPLLLSGGSDFLSDAGLS